MHYCLLIMPRVVFVISCIDYLMYRTDLDEPASFMQSFLIFSRGTTEGGLELAPTDIACEHELSEPLTDVGGRFVVAAAQKS